MKPSELWLVLAKSRGFHALNHQISLFVCQYYADSNIYGINCNSWNNAMIEPIIKAVNEAIA